MMNPDNQVAAQKKTIVLDSSTLITISDNCMIKIIKNLSQKENISFVIPQSVYEESVVTPMRIRKFELNAIRIRDAVEEGYLQVASATENFRQRLQKLQFTCDNLCTFNGARMIIIHRGEMETLALMKEINADALAIDERTTRLLLEEPQSLEWFLRKRHNGKISLNPNRIDEFRREYAQIKVIRSTELISLAYEDGSFGNELHTTKQAVEAALFAAKFTGCAVSEDEIWKYLKGQTG